MIISPHSSKITADHLKRDAYLYIRQSTLKQVMENTESTKRQYNLRQRGIALGWSTEQIIVIDRDQGQSGAQAADREGFQRLVAEVSLGKAGIVMGLEVSRLARNSMDWHRLLELCAMSHTLILDEEGVYDPNHYNDRLLLGLKGTLSEAELHVLKARLRGGIISKATRGELKMTLPIGFVYNECGKVVRNPDQQIQQSLFLLFQIFRQIGSSCATAKAFHEKKLLFPNFIRSGPNRGEIIWVPLTTSTVLRILHNPRYAGIYVFGRTRQVYKTNGGCRSYTKVPKKDWQIVIPNVHESYIKQEEYESNLQVLRDNYRAFSTDRAQSPPREGSALLQGIVLCGICGKRMTVRYHFQKGQLIPGYICQRESIEGGWREKACQAIAGKDIDKIIGNLLIEMVTPTALEVALAVQQEVEAHYAQVWHIYQQRVEAARYEVDLARRRYRQVDPDNRLVASTLEAEWNEKLKALEQAQDDLLNQQNSKNLVLSENQKKKIRALTQNFSSLWNSVDTPHRERKRIIRLLIEDVTLRQDNNQITLKIRFKGGTSRILTIPRPKNASEAFVTPPHIIKKIDRLSEEKTAGQIATQFNDQGLLSPRGLTFTSTSIGRIIAAFGLKTRYKRLREKGWLTEKELAQCLQIHPDTVCEWRRKKRLISESVDERGFCLYQPLDKVQIEKLKQIKGTHTCRRIYSLPSKQGVV